MKKLFTISMLISLFFVLGESWFLNYFFFFIDDYFALNNFYYDDLVGMLVSSEEYNSDYMESHYRRYEDYLQRYSQEMNNKYKTLKEYEQYEQNYQFIDKYIKNTIFNTKTVYSQYNEIFWILFKFFFAGALLGTWYLLLAIIWSDWRR